MLSNQRQRTKQAKFPYFPLEKALEKQTEKQVGALKSLDTSNEKNELKQIDGILSQNLMNDLICIGLEQVVNLQGIIKKDGKTYRGNVEKRFIFVEKLVILVNIHYLLYF